MASKNVMAPKGPGKFASGGPAFKGNKPNKLVPVAKPTAKPTPMKPGK